jgi:hypothetical protein
MADDNQWTAEQEKFVVFARHYASTVLGKNRDHDSVSRLASETVLLLMASGYYSTAILFPNDKSRLETTEDDELMKQLTSLEEQHLLEWPPLFLNVLKGMINDVRQDSVMGIRLGLSVNSRALRRSRLNDTINPLVVDYGFVQERECVGRNAPQRVSLSEKSVLSGSSSTTLKLALGFESPLATLSLNYSSSKSFSTTTHTKRTIQLAASRKKVLSVPLYVNRCDILQPDAGKVIKELEKVVESSANQQTVNKAIKLCLQFLERFGTHYCVENWIGASQYEIETYVEKKEKKTRSMGSKLAVPVAADNKVTAEGSRDTEDSREYSTKRAYQAVNGVIKDNVIHAEAAIYAVYEPIYKIFKNALFYPILKKVWHAYTSPSVQICREKQTNPRSDIYFLVVTENSIKLRKIGDVEEKGRTHFKQEFLPNGTFRLQVAQDEVKGGAARVGEYLGVNKPDGHGWQLTTYKKPHPYTTMFYDNEASRLGFQIIKSMGFPLEILMRQNYRLKLEVTKEKKKLSAFFFTNTKDGAPLEYKEGKAVQNTDVNATQNNTNEFKRKDKPADETSREEPTSSSAKEKSDKKDESD